MSVKSISVSVPASKSSLPSLGAVDVEGQGVLCGGALLCSWDVEQPPWG